MHRGRWMRLCQWAVGLFRRVWNWSKNDGGVLELHGQRDLAWRNGLFPDGQGRASCVDAGRNDRCFFICIAASRRRDGFWVRRWRMDFFAMAGQAIRRSNEGCSLDGDGRSVCRHSMEGYALRSQRAVARAEECHWLCQVPCTHRFFAVCFKEIANLCFLFTNAFLACSNLAQVVFKGYPINDPTGRTGWHEGFVADDAFDGCAAAIGDAARMWCSSCR